MSAILSKLFKPKWQHANPRTRLEAVRRLQADDAKQRNILVEVARTDSAVEVRCAALEKLDDLNLLGELLQPTQPPELQAFVRQRYGTLLAGETGTPLQLEERLRHLPQINDPQLLTHVANQADNLELRLQALAQLSDAEALIAIACDNSIAKVRIAAAERITQAEHLEQLIKRSKGKDKRVNRIARDALHAIRADEAARAEQQRRREDILNALESHVRAGFNPLFNAKFKHLISQWEAVEGSASAAQCTRYQHARQAGEQILAEQQAREQAALEQARKEAAIRKEQDAVCHTLREAWESLRQQLPDPQQLSALDSQLTLQQQRWDQLSQQLTPAPDSLHTFQQLREHLVTAISALHKLQDQQAALAQFADSALALDLADSAQLQRARKQLKQLLQQIQWPEALPVPPVLRQAAQALEHVQGLSQTRQQHKQQTLTEIRRQLRQLEQHLQTGELKPAGLLLKQLQSQVEGLPADDLAKVEPKLRQLNARFNELRDWQGFATAPKREELCAAMEALAMDTMEPPLKAERIKALQQEWKALGPVGASQTLWQRFKAAADQAYEPCRDYFAQEAEQRRRNLEQRQEICNQLQLFIDKADWEQVEPQAVEQILQQAKQEWRTYAPVNRAPGKPVQERFNQLLDQLHQVLDRYRQRNAEQKQELLEQARALLDQPDLRTATATAKQLQQQWRDIGPAPRAQEKQLWKAFRAVCDELFAKRDEQWQAQQQERERNHQQATQLIGQLEALLVDEHLTNDAKLGQAKQLQEQFNALGALPKQHANTVRDRFRAAFERIEQLQQQAAEQEIQAQWQELARKAQLCERLEQCLLQGQPVDLTELEAAWQSDCSLPKREAKALNQRWQRALQAARNQDSGKLQAMQDAQLQIRRQLCVQLETLAGLDTPPHDQPLRMEYQVSRLNQGLGQQRTLPRHEEARRIQAAWYASGPVDPVQAHPYNQRFEAAANALFSAD